MAKSGMKLNIAGFRQLRRSPAVQAHLLELGKKVADAAGEGYVAEASPGKNRARVTVHPNTEEAAVESARDPHILIGALDAARRG